MSDENHTTKQVSASDYIDMNLEDLQSVADYITKGSIPVGLTLVQAQRIVDIYSRFLNEALHNLNILRQLAGDGMFQIPESVEATDVREIS